jgi:hypothetical protein
MVKRLFPFLAFLYISACSVGVWNNSSYSYIGDVDNKILAAKGLPVELDKVQREALFLCLGFELKQFFWTDDLEPKIWAYWGRTSGFLDRNKVVLVRFSQDMRRYVRVFLDGSGKIWMHDSAGDVDGFKQEMFSPRFQTMAKLSGLRGEYDGLNYISPLSRFNVTINGKADLKSLRETWVDGNEGVSFLDAEGNKFTVVVSTQKVNDPRAFVEQMAASRQKFNQNVGTGTLTTGEPMFIETSASYGKNKKVRGMINVVFPRDVLVYDLMIETKEVLSEKDAGLIIRDGIEGLLAAVGVIKR